jgi:hypothetical protein
VRDQNDQWIRVAMKKGGMIVLPAGMYHRFTLDSNNYIKVLPIDLHPLNATSQVWRARVVVGGIGPLDAQVARSDSGLVDVCRDKER